MNSSGNLFSHFFKVRVSIHIILLIIMLIKSGSEACCVWITTVHLLWGQGRDCQTPRYKDIGTATLYQANGNWLSNLMSWWHFTSGQTGKDYGAAVTHKGWKCCSHFQKRRGHFWKPVSEIGRWLVARGGVCVVSPPPPSKVALVAHAMGAFSPLPWSISSHHLGISDQFPYQFRCLRNWCCMYFFCCLPMVDCNFVSVLSGAL